MTRALVAGLAYFAAVFAAGFVLGTLRVLLLAPIMAPVAAVLLELPMMLALSWIVCGWLLRRFDVPHSIAARAAMGGSAFMLLMIAEYAVSTWLFGRNLAAHIAHYREAEALFGLAAQLAFAMFPLARIGWARPARSTAHGPQV